VSALARAAGFFVAPAAERAEPRTVAAPRPEAIAVLGPLRDALPVASTLGTLIAVWDPDVRHVVHARHEERAGRPVGDAPSTPAASRLARWASDRGHDAVAHGRTVRVALAPEARHVAAEVTRLAGASGRPVVTVVSGPREPALDAFLAEQDAIVVPTRAETDPDLLALTLTGLGPRAVAVPALTGPTRLIAAAGWLRRDLTALTVPA
jgi:hypothetical protein